MQRHRSIIVLALALIMAVPAYAAAEWGGRGFYEPDTERDRLEGRMWSDPDQSSDAGSKRIYFGVYTASANVGVNPNVGAMRSSHISVPFTNFYAVLGVWKDCNGDGYVGSADSALIEYRSELLLDASICPAGQSMHNDGDWVYELRWIGPDNANVCEDPEAVETDGENDDNPFNLVDNCARVWSDIGYPEDGGEITCPVNPLPRGTLLYVGGAIRYADCIANYRIYDTTTLALDPVDDATGQQVSFDDAPRENPQFSDSPLNVRNPYGSEDEAAMATVWDCNGSPTHVHDPTAPAEGQPGMLRTVGVQDPTNTPALDDLENDQGYLGASANLSDEDGRLVSVWPVGSPGLNPTGSPAGTVNGTLEGSPSIGIFSNTIYGSDPEDRPDCDRSDGGHGEDYYVYDFVETDFEPSGALRRDTDGFFTFSENPPSGGNPTGVSEVPVVGQEVPDPTGESTPAMYGVGLARDGVLNAMRWTAQPSFTASRNPIIRIDDFQPQRAQPFTFYAYVDPSFIASNGYLGPAGVTTTFVYGAEHCVGTSRTTGLWDCDPDNWYVDANGKDIKNVWQVRVGQEYNFRDVDCYDETYLGGQPTTWTQLNPLQPTSCVR